MSIWSNLVMTFRLHRKEFQFKSGYTHIWTQGQIERRFSAKEEY